MLILLRSPRPFYLDRPPFPPKQTLSPPLVLWGTGRGRACRVYVTARETIRIFESFRIHTAGRLR